MSKKIFAALAAMLAVYAVILTGSSAAAGWVLFLAALVAALKYPFLLLLGLIALNPLDGELIWLGGYSVLAPIGVVMTGSCVLHGLTSRIKRRADTAVALTLGSLVLWACASVLFAYDAREAMDRLIVLCLGVAIYSCIVYLVRTPERLCLAVKSLALSSLMVVPVILISRSETLMSYAVGYRSAYVAYFSKPIAYLGSALLPGTFYAVVLTSQSRTWSQRALSGAGAVVCVGCGLLLLARTYLIGLIAGAVVLSLVLGTTERRKLMARILPAALVVLILALCFMPPMFYGRIADMLTLSDRASGRLDIWLANLHMAADHPLFGVGFGNSPLLVGPYLAAIGQYSPDTIITAHSVFLQLLSELGFLGLGLFVAFMLCVAWRFWTSLRRIPANQRGIYAVIGASATSVVVYCLVEPFLWQKLFWIVAGLTAAASALYEGTKVGRDGFTRIQTGGESRIRIEA